MRRVFPRAGTKDIECQCMHLRFPALMPVRKNYLASICTVTLLSS
jgi:hypothetical protein